MPRIHQLKCDTLFWPAVDQNQKRFELRYNDRDYHVGDLLEMAEYTSVLKSYTGRFAVRQIDYIYGGESDTYNLLAPGVVAMSISTVRTSWLLEMEKEARRVYTVDHIREVLTYFLNNAGVKRAAICGDIVDGSPKDLTSLHVAVQADKNQDLRKVRHLDFETYGALPMPVHFHVSDDAEGDWFDVC